MELKMKCFQANENEITLHCVDSGYHKRGGKVHKSSTIEIAVFCLIDAITIAIAI